MKKRYRGNTSVELLMVMLILILFSFTIYSLIDAGIKTEQKILAQKSSQIDARIALSFINMRLRQNDKRDSIHVKKYALSGKNAIIIQTRGDYEYDTWIYFLDGKIVECIVDVDAEPNEVQGTEIAGVLDFDVEFNQKGNSLIGKILYENNGKIEALEKIITLASA